MYMVTKHDTCTAASKNVCSEDCEVEEDKEEHLEEGHEGELDGSGVAARVSHQAS